MSKSKYLAQIIIVGIMFITLFVYFYFKSDKWAEIADGIPVPPEDDVEGGDREGEKKKES